MTRSPDVQPPGLQCRVRLGRRSLIGGGIASGLVSASTRPAPAEARDARMADRSLGSINARLVVQEWFSLTCTHCAAFARDVFPEVQAKLIDTGRIRYVFKDFPLDQIALAAAMVARSLPPARYEPFVLALLSSQDRWAFDRNADPQARLAQMSALAGMSKDAFDTAINDQGLQKAIAAEQDRGISDYKIDGTPTFIFGTSKVGRGMDFDAFLGQVIAAGG